MSEQPTPEEIAKQLKEHAESLGDAGVRYVPKTTDLPPPKTPEETKSAEVQHSLFAGVGPEPTKSSDEQRTRELTLLAETVSQCTRCSQLASTRTQTVFGVGPLDPELCFVGEAPGADEDREGEPFVGAAGQLLNRIISACGMKREEIYICNILRCRPPGNRTPLADEAANCREYLEKTIDLVRPRFICAFGGCAAQNLLGSSLSIGRLRKRFHDFNGIPVLCTYHPAFLLPHRSPERKRDVWEDMKMLLERMGRPIPEPKK